MPPRATLSPTPAVTRNPPPNKTNSRTKRSCAWPTGPTIRRDSVSPFLNVRRLIFKAASGPTPHRAPGPGPLLLSPPVPPGHSLARAEALSPAHEEGPRVTLLAAGPPQDPHREDTELGGGRRPTGTATGKAAVRSPACPGLRVVTPGKRDPGGDYPVLHFTDAGGEARRAQVTGRLSLGEGSA